MAPELPITPVLQGQSISDYSRCADLYERHGVDLAALPLVGVGSVCRRCRGFVRVSRWGECAGGWGCLPASCVVVDLGIGVVILTTFSAVGWESWGLGRK